MPTLTLFVIGTTIGGYGTLIGAGGGFLLVPVLLVLYPSDTTATITSLSLAIVALNALSGTAAYARLRRIDYQMAAVLSLSTVPATMLGAATSARLPRHLFEPAFGAVLLALAAFLLWKPLSQAAAVTHATGSAVPPPPAPGRLGVGLPISALVGFIAGLLGIGGSPLQVIVLTHVMHVSVHTAMPTAQFMVLLSAAAGVATHLWTGHFHVGLAPTALLGAGALIGAQAGALMSTRMSGGGLVRLMAVALLTVGVKLLVAPLF
jgi:uncharacterized membrane protein YfcA